MPDGVAARPRLAGLSLCSGVAGLELGLRLALGATYQTVAYCERDAYAAAALVARMEDAALDHAPIWDDLESFPGWAFRGKVDLISAGFPCQPWSCAGEQKGTDDKRWLWPAIERIIRDVGPTIVFLENVPGLLVPDGIGAVLGSLADLGFDAEWTCLRASDVGAPHKRNRVFILGNASDDHGRGRVNREETGIGPNRIRRRGSASAGGHVADAGCWRTRRSQPFAESGSRNQAAVGEDDPEFPPGPEDAEAWRDVLVQHPELRPAISQAEAESQLCGGPDEFPARLERLRCLGNAVVPAQAAAAFRELAGRLPGGGP